MPRAFPTRHAPRIPPPSFPGIPPLSFPPVVSGNPERRAMTPIDLAPRIPFAVMAPSCDDKTDTRRFVLVPGILPPSFSGHSPTVILQAFPTRPSRGIPHLSFPPVVSGNPERRAMTPIDLAPRITYAVMAPSCDDKTDTRHFVLVPRIPHPSFPRHSPPVLPGASPNSPSPGHSPPVIPAGC